jgi:hypothetical protein
VDKDCHQCDGVRRKVLQLEPIILQQREEEDSGGTSPARVYAEKKTKYPGSMLVSNAIQHFSLGLRSGACHPISHRRLAREPVILNREDKSSATMAVDGGQRLRRKQEA